MKFSLQPVGLRQKPKVSCTIGDFLDLHLELTKFTRLFGFTLDDRNGQMINGKKVLRRGHRPHSVGQAIQGN